MPSNRMFSTLRISNSFQKRFALCLGAMVASSFSNIYAADWADLKITFVYDSATLPKAKEVAIGKDEVCVKTNDGKTSIPDGELIVNEANKGIMHVAFYPDTKKSGIDSKDVHPDLAKAPAEPVVLDNINCVFVPHVFTVRTGQSITVKNSDETGHNALFNTFANPAQNMMIPQGGSKDFLLSKPERAPIPIECSIHPWMKAHALIFDHPYAGISDKDGVLTIEKLPAGKPITFKIWHEVMNKSIEKVTFEGKSVEWKKGLVELTLKPGMNDLGEVKIKPSEFK